MTNDSSLRASTMTDDDEQILPLDGDNGVKSVDLDTVKDDRDASPQIDGFKTDSGGNIDFLLDNFLEHGLPEEDGISEGLICDDEGLLEDFEASNKIVLEICLCRMELFSYLLKYLGSKLGKSKICGR